MTTTPILGLPLLAAAQAQNHVTHNEALEVLDAIVAIAVRDRHLAGPPAAPAPLAAEGERFIVADNPTDDWVGKARHVAQRRDGGWRFFAPKAGWVARTLDDGEMVVFDGTDWRPLLSSGADVAQVSRLGVGTPSDANNAFAFKGGQLFFTAKTAAEGGDGDLRLVLNKENAGDVLSVLFQRGWSARAELGLVGGDDLTLRVSPDGSTWLDAFSVDRASGRVAFTAGVVRIERVAISSSANFVAPAWARRALIRGVGGGGGGGSGRRGAAGTSRGGGGGGSHAVYVERELFASVGGVTNHFNPGATFAVTIGAGGAGGIAVAANDTNGAAGANGGITSVMIGSVEVFRASGGVGGLGGTATTAAGGWQAIASTLGLNTQGGTGGAPSGTNAVWSSHAGGSGGGGGGVGATDAPGGGGWGGSGSLNIGTSMGGAPGTAGVAGSVGASPVDTSFGGGGGGGGGAGAIGGGGARGAGGGGGGGSMNGTSSGAGGAGGNGFVEITWFG